MAKQVQDSIYDHTMTHTSILKYGSVVRDEIRSDNEVKGGEMIELSRVAMLPEFHHEAMHLCLLLQGDKRQRDLSARPWLP